MGILEKNRKIIWFSIVSPHCPTCEQELSFNLRMMNDEDNDSWLQFYTICIKCNWTGTVVLDGYNIDDKYVEVVRPKDS